MPQSVSAASPSRRLRLSRLRLRLAAVFSITFVAALTVVALGSMAWLLRESTHRLDRRLDALTASVARGVALEKGEYPDSTLLSVVSDVQREWVVGPDVWIARDVNGHVLATTADSATTHRMLRALPSDARLSQYFTVDDHGGDLRVVTRWVPEAGGLPAYGIVAAGSTESIERDTERLTLALAVVAPLIALVSLGAGYAMARWALKPAAALGRDIDAIGPASPLSRLPVHEPPDEISELAQRFNALLDRLADSQAQNRDFVREAAHQIRTPLTLVHGEAEYALSTAAPDAATLHAALSRIERASRQMQRRVNDLLLLAEAEAGAVLEQRAPVELDALALEGVDLFRARAAQFGRPLAYGVLDAAVVRGDDALLREALLELLENACRHGLEASPISVSVEADASHARLTVESVRASTPSPVPSATPSGLGQRIVRWIAEAHGGDFQVRHDDTGRYMATVSLPIAS